MFTPAEKQKMIDSVPHWWHSIEFGDGVFSEGREPRGTMLWDQFDIPIANIKNKRVLDIGAWDGKFSFLCEQAGAKTVLAVDVSQGFSNSNGFHVAKKILNSKVVHMDEDFLNLKPAEVGKFDLIIFAGVLYHLENPLGGFRALKELLSNTGLIVIETTTLPDEIEEPYMKFHLKKDLGNDPTNFWTPSPSCVEQMLLEVGLVSTLYKRRTRHKSRSIFHAEHDDKAG